MASISKHKDKWRVKVRKTDPYTKEKISISKVFEKKGNAQKWGRTMELQIESGEFVGKRDAESVEVKQVETEMEEAKNGGKTVGDLLRHYRDNYLFKIPDKKKSLITKKFEAKIINATIIKCDFANIPLNEVSHRHVAQWSDERLLSINGDSVRREWSPLSNAFNYGVRRMEWIDFNPMIGVDRPSRENPRTATFSEEQVKEAAHVSGYSEDSPPITIISRVGAALLFALETAIRQSELAKITWDMVDTDRIRLTGNITKERKPRIVPLSKRAKQLSNQLAQMKKGDSFFQLSATQISDQFRLKIKPSCTFAGEDILFRDSRPTALTKMAKYYEPLQLAKISGHRDLNMLLNTYYRPDGDDLVETMKENDL